MGYPFRFYWVWRQACCLDCSVYFEVKIEYKKRPDQERRRLAFYHVVKQEERNGKGLVSPGQGLGSFLELELGGWLELVLPGVGLMIWNLSLPKWQTQTQQFLKISLAESQGLICVELLSCELFTFILSGKECQEEPP